MTEAQITRDASAIDRLSPKGKALVMRLVRRCALYGDRPGIQLIPQTILDASKEVCDCFESELGIGFEQYT